MQDSSPQDVVDAKDLDSLSKHLNEFNKEKSITGDLKNKKYKKKNLWPGNPKATRLLKEYLAGEVSPNLGAAPCALSTCH